MLCQSKTGVWLVGWDGYDSWSSHRSMDIHTRLVSLLYAACLIGSTPAALADSVPGPNPRATYAPIAVIQATPGLHLTLSGGMLGIGVTGTVGWRAGGGALAATLFGGFMPFGMLTYDQGLSFGALTGTRRGIHARSIYGGIGANLMEEGRTVFTLGAELPLLPVPAVE